jgi:hypothetical protein
MNSTRPPLLVVLCVLAFIGCFFNIFMVISPPVQRVSSWYPAYLSLSTVFEIVCLGGLLMMRRSAVIGMTVYTVSNQVVYHYLGTWTPYAIVLPGAITIVAWVYYRKMPRW